MPTYAILGATGSTGSSVLQLLAENPENQIHALVRSKSKLEGQMPRLVGESQVQIYEGNITDIDALAACIRGTRAVFMTVATPNNVPHCRISQDAAESVVSALQRIRSEEPESTLPRLIVLSSSATERYLLRRIPAFVYHILFAAHYWLYTDLLIAERYLRARSDWIDSTFIKPGGLVHDKQRGHILSTDRDQTFLGFLDLAAGMIEVAEGSSEHWVQKAVSVRPATPAKFEWMAPVKISRGLVFTYFPFLYHLFY